MNLVERVIRCRCEWNRGACLRSKVKAEKTLNYATTTLLMFL